MRRIWAFAGRNVREILRDPLSYLFCLGFPLVMLVVMTLVDRSVPPEAGMTLFRIDRLAGGIAVFGQSFVMLFTALTVAKDRSSAFLMRLYASPMTSPDFTAGYLLPMLAISAAQSLAICPAAALVAFFTGVELPVGGLLLMAAVLLVSGVFYIALGLLFGTLFSEKAAPALSSIVVSLGAFLGGVWYDAEAVGGVLLRLSRALPFWYAVRAARSAVVFDFGKEVFWFPLAVVAVSAALASVLAAAVFHARMRADLG